jgi:hypothetical protein
MGDKKKKVEQEEDLTTEQFQRIYRKRCELNGVPVCKILKDKIE